MLDPYSISISAFALMVSCTTAWLTFFRVGKIKMTQPTVIFFGSEAPRTPDETPLPKVFLRTLLFATSKRGRIIESMYARLCRDETHQNFNIWVYGNDKLVRGSGLFVGETGVEANHHFLLPRRDSAFQFSQGSYKLDVFARLLGDNHYTLLFTQTLEISQRIAESLEEPGAGLYFDWGPDSSRYLHHVDRKPLSPNPEKFLDLLGLK